MKCAALAFALTACATERERPSPAEVAPASLGVRVVQPRHGVTVVAGTTIEVIVEARDLRGTQLVGIGFVSRRLGSGNNATIDSVALRFPQTSDSTHGFDFPVPATLPTNTQLDIWGIAYGPGGQTAVSVPVSVIVARLTEPADCCATPTRWLPAVSNSHRR